MSGELEQALAAADGGTRLLDADDVPNANQSLTCFSCDTPMQGLYCHACGNKNDDFRRSIWSLGVELFANITAVDSRVWRSLWSLVRRPGRMAREFADGARTRWTSPVRMFLATSLLLFGYIVLSGTQIVAFGTLTERSEASPSIAGIHSDDYQQALHFFVPRSRLVMPEGDELDIRVNQFAREFGAGLADGLNDVDELEAAVDSMQEIRDTMEHPAARAALENTLAQTQARLEIARAEAEAGEVEATDEADSETGFEGNSVSINTASGDTFSLNNDGVRSVYTRLLRNPEIVNDRLNDRLKWVMFFMLPLAMLQGAIFIRGRNKAMLYDHLVHAAYVHSFSFILLFVWILLGQYTPIPSGPLFLSYVLILLVYLPASAKGMFQRGWFKSVLTAYSVGAVYTFVVFIFAIIIVAGAVTDLASEYGTTVPSGVDASTPDQTL